MTRAAIIAAVLALAIASSFWAGLRWDAAKESQDTIDTIERINDALDNPNGCAWPDRLRGACD